MKALINQRLVGSGFEEFKVSRTIISDVIFFDCLPSLAVKFCYDLSHTTVKEIENLQKQMKNSVAIGIGSFSPEAWNQFQMNISAGSIRIVRTTSVKSAAAMALEFYETMKDNAKSKLQAKYFELEKERSHSSEMSRLITTTTMSKLGIPEFEASLLLEQFPSISRLILATLEQLYQNRLVEEGTVEKIVELFRGVTPTIR